MKGFDRLHIKSAVKSHSKFDLSNTHLTTMNFGEIMPLWLTETVPGDKFSVNAQVFSRMAPLVKPTYGKVNFNTMASFVPFFQVCDEADAFIAGKTTWEGDTPFLRYFDSRNILYLMTDSDFSSTVSSTNRTDNGNGYLVLSGSTPDPVKFDFQYYNTNGTLSYRILTAKGKFVLKVLNALGYSLPTCGSIQSSSAWQSSPSNIKYSALPLLCFFKAYNDWMSQSQRYNTSDLTKILKKIRHNSSIGGYSTSTGYLTYNLLKTMFSYLLLCYENDYFTSAWMQPNNPLNNGELVNQVPVPGNSLNGDFYIQDYVNMGTSDNFITPSSGSTSQGVTRISQRSLDFLQSFDNWVRRNNYAGSRAVQNVYARFGIKTEDYRSNYAHVIDVTKQPIQVGDVTAQGAQFINGDAEHSTQIGDYAGKGIMNSNGSWSYQASEYGILMVLGWYSVSPMNSYGFDHICIHTDPMDFYTPEFDGLGAQPIPIGELCSTPISSGVSSAYSLDDKIFGFTERYNEYRFGRDKITGEFRDYHDGADMNVWHTGRLLTKNYNAQALVAQSTTMNCLPQTDSEYNRIFSVTDKDVDKFYVTAQFHVSAVRPMMSLNQVPRLGEGNTVVERNGNEVN